MKTKAMGGLSFQLSEEQEELRNWARGFAEKESGPLPGDDEKEEFLN